MNVDVSKITVSTSPFHLKLPGNPVDYKKNDFRGQNCREVLIYRCCNSSAQVFFFFFLSFFILTSIPCNPCDPSCTFQHSFALLSEKEEGIIF